MYMELEKDSSFIIQALGGLSTYKIQYVAVIRPKVILKNLCEKSNALATYHRMPFLMF